MTDHSALIERLEGEPGDCPFCGSDPYHYVDNGVGMERVAVTCCDEGIAYFQHGDPVLTEQVALRREAAAALRDQQAALEKWKRLKGYADDQVSVERAAYRSLLADHECGPLPSSPNQAKEAGE